MIKSRTSRKGATLIELMIVLVLLSVLGGAAMMVFNVVLLSWSSQTERSGADLQLERAAEEMVRDLREARQFQSTAGRDEVRYTTDGSTFFIFYLYNAGDTYGPPPAFNQTVYQLRRATLTGGLSGTFTYGSGTLLLTEVLPPATSDLSASGNLITLDLSVERKEETVRLRTQVRPRNL